MTDDNLAPPHQSPKRQRGVSLAFCIIARTPGTRHIPAEIIGVPWTPPPTNTASKKISETIARFPKTPGVYLMKISLGRVLYVGKAKDLRSRAGSYFQDSADTPPRRFIPLNGR